MTSPQHPGVLAHGETVLDGSGMFHVAATLPANCPMGTVTIKLSLVANKERNSTHEHLVKVEAYRRSAFGVHASSNSSAATDVIAEVDARYYSGSPLRGSDVTWKIDATPVPYVPNALPGFIYWDSSGRVAGLDGPREFTARTDAGGKHQLLIACSNVAAPLLVSASATVQGPDHQVARAET